MSIPESAGTNATDRVSTRSGTKLRVVFLLRVEPDAAERFLAAYEQIRHQVAQVRGHLRDQLCQSPGDSRQWLITSEWARAEDFTDWEAGADHRQLVKPMMECVTERQSFRFLVIRETS